MAKKDQYQFRILKNLEQKRNFSVRRKDTNSFLNSIINLLSGK